MNRCEIIWRKVGVLSLKYLTSNWMSRTDGDFEINAPYIGITFFQFFLKPRIDGHFSRKEVEFFHKIETFMISKRWQNQCTLDNARTK